MSSKKNKNNIKSVFVILTVMIAVAAVSVFTVLAFEDHKNNLKHGVIGMYTSSDARHRIYGDLADINIELSIGGSKEILTFNEISDWITTEKNGSKMVYSVIDDKVREYTAMLDRKYSNYQSYITFNSVYGKEITLENKGMGWIFDPDHAFSMLKEYIKNASSVKLDLTDRSPESNKWWLRTASVYGAADNQKNIFAEVSIDNQYMWVRKNNRVIFESPVVTGDPNLGNDTPKGAYAVYEKKSPSNLYGPGYNTEVSYWIAFNDDIGFHDATWQDSFGGTAYLSNGSHGCVNMPLDTVDDLYNIAYIGMPVYVY